MEAENSQLRKGNKAMQEKCVKAERDLKITEENRDGLAFEVDELYQEINALKEGLKFLGH